jgi:hypothetical protein
LGLETLEDRTVPTFLAPVGYSAGTTAAAVAVGDFNGDDRPDLIVANNLFLGTVSVLPGNGDGSFGAPISSPGGTAPTTMTVADFNGDGKLDVATGNPSSVSINLLMGNGDGTFQAPVVYLLGASPTHLTEGDINNDGHPDLVASSTGYGGTTFVLKNNGDGTFAPAQGYAANVAPQDVELADLNNDGKLDLIISNQVSFGVITTMLGNGDGTFQSAHTYSAGSAPYKLTIGDFNNDGNADVAVLNSYTSNMMSIVLGNGDGTFGPYTSYSLVSGFNDIETADFNNDGNLDLIESNGQVELGRGDGSFYAATTYTGFSGGSLAAGDFNGDGALDVVTTTSGNAVVMTNAANDTALLGGAVALQVSAPATVTAGAPFAVTVSAVDANGNVVPGFLGTVGLRSTNAAYAAQAVSYTFTAADAGTHTIPNAAVLTAVGTQSFSVTSPLLPTATGTVLVTPAAGTHFAVSGPASTNAGDPTTSIMVTALDAFGNVATGYTGTVSFRSSDVQAVLPTAYTFTTADAGGHTFHVTLKSAGNQTVTAADTVFGSVSGTSGAINVIPGAASTLNLVGGGGYVGSSHLITVTARDLYGNVATSYNGTVHLTTSDALATLSPDGPLTNGTGTFTITPMTLGTQTISAADVSNSALSGSESVLVTPGQGVRYTLTPLASTTAGVSQFMTVTVWDAFGNVSTVYNGTIRITSSDAQAGVIYYTYTVADAGVHTFIVTLKTAGTQSVTATDTVNLSVTASQAGVVVTPAVAASISVTPLHGTTAGVAQSFTVTARDAYGNVASGYRGTLVFGSSDTQAVLPAPYTFTATDAGVHTFSMTFKTAGGQTFTVQDTANAANPAFNYLQTDIAITPAAMVGFALRAPSNVTAGVAFTVTVSAVDTYGNLITGYRGKIHFSGPSGGGNLLPADYTFTASDNGVHSFSITLVSTGTQTIGVQDVANGSLRGQVSVNVRTSGGSGGGGTGGGGTGGGGTGGGGGGGGGVA